MVSAMRILYSWNWRGIFNQLSNYQRESGQPQGIRNVGANLRVRPFENSICFSTFNNFFSTQRSQRPTEDHRE